MKIGLGYDVHKLVKNRDLILGGVKINHEKGLLGHSDADVLLHSIMDSLLGAACLGDIGTHFPDTNLEYKNISSLILLKKVNNLINEKGYKIINIDCCIIAQRPKIFSYINEMKNNICSSLNITKDQLNIKATTEEGLGFTGNEEGISCQSICLLN